MTQRGPVAEGEDPVDAPAARELERAVRGALSRGDLHEARQVLARSWAGPGGWNRMLRRARAWPAALTAELLRQYDAAHAELAVEHADWQALQRLGGALTEVIAGAGQVDYDTVRRVRNEAVRLAAAGRPDVPPDVARAWMAEERSAGVAGALLRAWPLSPDQLSRWIMQLRVRQGGGERQADLVGLGRRVDALEAARALCGRAVVTDAQLHDLYWLGLEVDPAVHPLSERADWSEVVVRLLLGGAPPHAGQFSAEIRHRLCASALLGTSGPTQVPRAHQQRIVLQWPEAVSEQLLRPWLDAMQAAGAALSTAATATLLQRLPRESRLCLLAHLAEGTPVTNPAGGAPESRVASAPGPEAPGPEAPGPEAPGPEAPGPGTRAPGHGR